VNHIKCMREQWNQELKPINTIGGRGYEFDLLTLLQYLLKNFPPKDPTQIIRIKLAFDGATMSSNRIQQEIGTVQIRDNKRVAGGTKESNTNNQPTCEPGKGKRLFISLFDINRFNL